jgi:hypothetical protein
MAPAPASNTAPILALAGAEILALGAFAGAFGAGDHRHRGCTGATFDLKAHQLLRTQSKDRQAVPCEEIGSAQPSAAAVQHGIK